jgi:hypothetical protein
VTSAEALWAAYLDAVELAARDVERQAVEHGVPVLAPLPQPAVPWPPALEARRREVLAALAAAQETVRSRRDQTGAALAALPRRGVRFPGGYADGEHLNVVG